MCRLFGNSLQQSRLYIPNKLRASSDRSRDRHHNDPISGSEGHLTTVAWLHLPLTPPEREGPRELCLQRRETRRQAGGNRTSFSCPERTAGETISQGPASEFLDPGHILLTPPPHPPPLLASKTFPGARALHLEVCARDQLSNQLEQARPATT